MIFSAFLLFAFLFWLGAVVLMKSFSGFFLFVDALPLLYIALGVTGYFLLFGRNKFGLGVKTFFAFSYPPGEDYIETGQFFLRFATFILSWGVFGALAGTVLVTFDLNPDTLGQACAVILLSPLYALGLSLFVFLPIGLRLSPPTVRLPGFWRFSVWQQRLSLAAFLLLGYLIICLSDLGIFPPSFDARKIWLFVDLPSMILILGSWWLFRMASGTRRRWIGVPTVILMGFLWAIMGMIMVLNSFVPETLGPGFAVSLVPAFYGFLVAIGFLIADNRSENGAPSPVLEENEEVEPAREFISNAIATERR